MRTYSICLALAIILLFPTAHAQWVQTNGPNGGSVSSLAVNGTNIFAGTENRSTGLLFLSTNFGSSWTPVTYGLPGQNGLGGSQEVTALASFGKVSLVGINELANCWCPSLFRSTDNGTSWTKVTDFPYSYGGCGDEFTGFASTGTDLFAGVKSWGPVGVRGGVFRSSDGGMTWVAYNKGLTNSNVLSLVASPSGALYAGTERGVFFSHREDFGEEWFAMSNGLTDTIVTSLAVSGTNLFAGTSIGGVFASTDSGATWAAISSGLTNASITSLAMTGTDMFAGTNQAGVFRSTDNGSNWIAVNSGLPDAVVSQLAVCGTNIFVGTSAYLFSPSEPCGVFLSTNNGTTWTKVGLPILTVNDLAVSGANLFAGTHRGVFLSTNDGGSWLESNNGLAGTDIVSLVVSGTKVFAGVCNNGVFVTTNNGASWRELLSAEVWSLAVIGTNVFAGTTSGVLRSTNNGLSWGAQSAPFSSFSEVVTIGSILFAGTNEGGVFLSTNDGKSWTAVNNGLTNTGVLALAVSGTTLFAGTAGGGVFRSTNNGTSWAAVNTGLPIDESDDSVDVTCFAVSGTNIFAATNTHGDWFEGEGVFLSTDNGTHWSAVNSGLSSPDVVSITNSGTNLFAGTTAPGVWCRPLSEVITSVNPPTSELPREFLLRQNYPNPFNPSTTIRYELPHSSRVTLKVHNTLGQEVATLVNETKAAGMYTVEFDARSLASGVYFYKLQARDFISTKKMLVVK